MLRALLLLVAAHARAEWVEITQLYHPRTTTNYPKLTTNYPKLTTNYPKLTTKLIPEPEHYENLRTEVFTETSRTPGNRVYINHSLEKHWNKGVVQRISNLGNVKRIQTTQEPARVKYEETDLSVEVPNGYTKRNPFKAIEEKIPEFVTKEESFEEDEDDQVRFVRKPPNLKERNAIKNTNINKPNIPIRRLDTETELPEHVTFKTDNAQKHGDESAETGAKVNTMENVLKFVKVVADTISRNTRRSFSSKLRYLEDLKDTIMVNIEDRIESLFPDETEHPGQAARRRRWARWARSAEARGHVEFPSSEGALMTISFLTFAVYLIKLVLQVIHTYKNKTMMVTPALFAAVGRTAGGVRRTSNNDV